MQMWISMSEKCDNIFLTLYLIIALLSLNKYKKFTRKIFTQKNFTQKIFTQKKFHPKNFHQKNVNKKEFSSKKFSSKKFSPKKFSPKIFSPQKNFHPKNFHQKNVNKKEFSSKKFSSKKFSPKKFSPKKFFTQKNSPEKFSLKKNFTQKIFTQIVWLTFVDLRWAQLYVSLVILYISRSGSGGVSHLGPDRKEMWKFWPIFSIVFWFFDTQNTLHIIVKGLKYAFLSVLNKSAILLFDDFVTEQQQTVCRKNWGY